VQHGITSLELNAKGWEHARIPQFRVRRHQRRREGILAHALQKRAESAAGEFLYILARTFRVADDLGERFCGVKMSVYHALQIGNKLWLLHLILCTYNKNTYIPNA